MKITWPVTECERDGCRLTGHVVLFAAGGVFDGREYRRGQIVVYCLKHGGDIYTAHGWNRGRNTGQLPAWLKYDTNQLPTVRADWHTETAPGVSRFARGGRIAKTRMPDRAPARTYR